MYHTFISAILIRWLITKNVPWFDLLQVPFYWGKGEGTLKPFPQKADMIPGYLSEVQGETPSNGLYGEAPPKGGNFFRLQVCKRQGFNLVQA